MTKMVFWKCPITTHNRGVKKQNQNTTERLTVLGQFCKLIPKYCLANVCAELNKERIKIAARAFSVWSHIVSMIYCHMAHCISLNDICDGLQNFKGNLNNIRNATAPHRNTLSHANRTRDITLIKNLSGKLSSITSRLIRTSSRRVEEVISGCHGASSEPSELLILRLSN